jgi:tellurite resistance protein TerB
MKKSRPEQADIFVRRPVAEMRASLSRLDIAAEADIAGLEPFMEASIAAAVIIAHADGEADVTERKRIISLFRANPLLQGFSAEDVAREITSQSNAFALDYPSALERAHAQISVAELSHDQFRALLHICVSVLEADGVRHPAEEAALAAISSLRQWGHR